MSSEYRQRADLLGTEVITRSTGKRLGVVSQLWVDVDRQEVVALSLRPSLFYGTPQQMSLSSIRQIGDVILVDDEDVIEDIDVDRYSSLVNCEVITETGTLLGKARGFKFNVDTGQLVALTIASLGYPLIPDRVISTYELPIEEIVSSGPDRLIVYEGAEERLTQMTVGLLEQVGIGAPPWEKDMTFQPPTLIRPENQLPSATRAPMQPPATRRPEPASIEQTWDEDGWEREPERIEVRLPQRQQQAQFLEEEDRWSETVEHDRYNLAEVAAIEEYQDVEYAEVTEVEESVAVAPVYPVAEPTEPEPMPVAEPTVATEVAMEETTGTEDDPWSSSDDTPPDYQPQAFKIPEKVKQPEYEPEYEE
jgi:sporulation protein YlmC with PRC-barrel domain